MPTLYNEVQLPLEKSLETAVRRVGVSCETVAEDIAGIRHQATTGEDTAD
jgi:hypothetical protein